MTSLRFAILGAGRHAQRVMLPAFADSEHAIAAALATRSSVRASELADSFPGTICFSSYEAALDCTDIDAIYIALPPALHSEWTRRALAAGKHVLCEKPLALSGKDAREAAQAAERAGLVLLEALAPRFHPLHGEVEKLAKGGALGQVLELQSEFSYDISGDAGNIRRKPQLGGGIVFDTLCYHLEICRRIFGNDPKYFSGEIICEEESQLDVEARFSLEFPCGGQARFFSSMRSPRCHSYLISGTRGQIRVPRAFLISRKSEPQIELKSEGGSSRTIRTPAANQYVSMIDAFALSAAAESTLSDHLQWSLEAADLAQRLLQSAVRRSG